MKRIVSLLPAATEMLFALGLGPAVAGVTFECDYPAAVTGLPRVVQSSLPEGLTPEAIDAMVTTAGAAGRSLYFADMPLLEALAPDLVVLQDLCQVCALDSPTMARDLSQLGSHPAVVSLSGQMLEGVFADVERLGAAAGRPEEALALTTALRARLEAVRRQQALPKRPRVLALEWLQPFFQGGHWVPEMITLAGGEPVLAEAGAKSVRLRWEAIREADPEVIVAMPCGYGLQATVAQYREQVFPEGWRALRAVQERKVYAVDGSAYFSRPGPRLVEGTELLAAMLRGQPGDYVRL